MRNGSVRSIRGKSVIGWTIWKHGQQTRCLVRPRGCERKDRSKSILGSKAAFVGAAWPGFVVIFVGTKGGDEDGAVVTLLERLVGGNSRSRELDGGELDAFKL
jgi:hypothetical protein